ncbi:HET-domain-containing protein [Daldinia caldariorum]|uniref:HET-domain-containing protein n=1 Tax=Daldinia caldariorum TaxID=326644 RepID=UPI002007E191|nr:HET-domain-containing protein [Daldinia caldariorum]KAI1472826.1 HET-domain-containing protein [Daldinia caldariorum]
MNNAVKALTTEFLNNVSQAPTCPDDNEKIIVLPKYWNWLSNLKRLWDRREVCSGCGWDGNPARLLRVPTPQDQRNIIFSRPSSSQCICCKIINRLVQLQPNLDPDRWTVSLWINQDKPCVILEDSWLEEDQVEWNLFLANTQQRDLSGIPKGFLVSGNTASEAACEWAKQQLSACCQNHQHCPTGSNSFLPTRLIYIAGTNDEIRLVDSSRLPSNSRYVALSHCWGTRIPKCLTTRNNFLDQLENIPWSTIPKSFQEAILFARKLGIDYLWIDSICIIQRDPEDWLREAGRMFPVYRNAFLTLAASHAEDSSKGLFSILDPAVQLQLGVIRHGTEEYQLYAQQSFPEVTNLYLNHRSEPLFKRGWTFQERLVSPRILYFTKHELIWECYSTSICECGFHRDGPYNPTSLKMLHVNTLVNDPSFLQQSPEHYSKYMRKAIGFAKKSNFSKVDTEKTWRRIVQFYSDMQLTNQTDRLLAIGATAEQTQAIRKNKAYLAGLWYESLELDLLWARKRKPKAQQRSERYIAPTWSWASISGPVAYDLLSPLKAHVQVLGTSCEYIDGNQFGQAAGGQLVLRGESVPCTLCKPSEDSPEDYRILHSELTVELEVSIDCEPSPQEGEQSAVVMLRIADTCEFPAPVSLILKEEKVVDGQVVYTRLGLASPPGVKINEEDKRRKLADWFDRHSETRTCIII